MRATFLLVMTFCLCSSTSLGQPADGKDPSPSASKQYEPFPDRRGITTTAEEEEQTRAVIQDEAAMKQAIASVRAVDPVAGQENDLTRLYYQMLLKWVPYADKTYRSWPHRPHCGYFFGGRWHHGLETPRTAAVYALLAKFGPYDEKVTGIPREVIKQRAIAAIRYAAFTFDLGPADCQRTDGKKWGRLFPASSYLYCNTGLPPLGRAAWILWDDLDDETRRLVANAVVGSMERYLLEEPDSGYLRATQAEENGGTAAYLALGPNMFPGHPRAPAWEQAARKWMMNIRTVTADRGDTTLVGDRRVSDWVVSTNMLPDFTLENHGFSNSGYLGAALNWSVSVSIPYLLAGRHVPEQNNHHLARVYQNYKKWIEWDGSVTHVSGTDWWYVVGYNRPLMHGGLAMLLDDSDASYLERVSLDYLKRMQDSDPQGRLNGGFATKWENAAAWGRASAYLLHYFGGLGPEPTPAEQFHSSIAGVTKFPHARLITHRRQRSLVQLSWGHVRMAYAMPEGGVWVITPHQGSYFGAFNENVVTHRDKSKELIAFHDEPGTDRFSAVAHLKRSGKIDQYVAFASLPDDIAVYLELSKAGQDVENVTVRTGTIGVRNEDYRWLNELAPGQRTLWREGGEQTIPSCQRESDQKDYRWDAPSWVNVDDKVGYLLHGSQGVLYQNRRSRKGCEDFLHLNASADSSDYQPGEVVSRFSLVTYLNQSHRQTEQLALQQLNPTSDSEQILAVFVPVDSKHPPAGYLVVANLWSKQGKAVLSMPVAALEQIPLFEGTVRITNGRALFETTLPGLRLRSHAVLMRLGDVKGVEQADLVAEVSKSHKIKLTNRARDTVTLTVECRGESNLTRIGPGESQTITFAPQ